MTLTSQTKIGLTFGQIIIVIGFVISTMLGWTNLQIRMSTYELNQIEVKSRIVTNEKAIETVRVENKDDHKGMFLKFDEILQNQNKNNR